MPLSTISNTVTVGVTVGTTYASPLTITSTGMITLSGAGNAIFGLATQAWTIINQGSLLVGGSTGDGVDLRDGGSIDNSGLIEAPTAVYIYGAAGTITNTATIASTGADGIGIELKHGGWIDNSGLIEAPTAVYIYGAAGTLTNTETIAGTGADDTAVDLNHGGSVSNTGMITGSAAGIDITGAAGTLTNSGTIAATGNGFDGVNVSGGGSVTNNAGGLIEGNGGGGAGVYIGQGGLVSGNAAAAVTNAGTIEGTGGAGINLHVQLGESVDNTGLIEGFGGVYFVTGTASTLTNSGTITGTANPSFGKGVVFDFGGSVDNAAGLIEGHYFGVQIAGGSGFVTNGGTIIGLHDPGIELTQGGSVDNTAGLIEGSNFGVYVYGSAGTVANSGIIASTATASDGLRMKSGGYVSNNGTISGQTIGVYIFGQPGTVVNSSTIAAAGTSGIGIALPKGGTVVDSGTISGAGGTAIYFGGSGPNLLVLENGYHFQGSARAGITGTLELAGSLGAAVTASYNGLTLSSFSDALFGAGGNNTLKVSNTGGTLPLTISGFTLTGDVVDLTAIGTNGTIASQSGTEVTVTGSLGSVTLRLDASDATNLTVASDGATGTDLGVACFCRGTLIRTERGEVAVEDLAIGDSVVTFAGAGRAVKWIGRRSYDGRFVASNPAVLPICIAAGALGGGVPARDLFVSPEHALYLDGSLLPARLLANGGTIRQVERIAKVEYFHIELDSHDIIWAEGAAAETFVDCDNRLMFQNAGEFAALYPDDDRPAWRFCAPRLDEASAALSSIRVALSERAEAFGHRPDPDPDLHLVVDGRAIWPESIEGERYRFAIPAGSLTASLASRSVVPAEIEAGACDIRRLGVPVERIALFDAERSLVARHDDAELRNGFHADEETHRWTDGLASLPESWLRAFPSGAVLEVTLIASGLCYRVPPARIAAAG